MRKKQKGSYLENISDLMAGLAIFFLLLFVVVMITNRSRNEQVKEYETILEKIETLKSHQQTLKTDIGLYVKDFDKTPSECFREDQVEVVRSIGPQDMSKLADTEIEEIGVVFRAKKIFKIGSPTFSINDETKTILKCLLKRFYKEVIYKNKDLIKVSYIEAKADLLWKDRNYFDTDPKSYLSLGYRKNLVLTLDRARTIFDLVFNSTKNFELDELKSFNKVVAGAGLGWITHANRIYKEENKLIPKGDENQRSFQIRILLKQQDELLKSLSAKK